MKMRCEDGLRFEPARAELRVRVQEEQVGLFGRRQDGTDTAIRASASDTVGRLKERVSAVDSIAIPTAEQRLLVGGAELDEESAVLADLGVGSGGVVYLVRRLEVPPGAGWEDSTWAGVPS